jgi:hypothetical protein
MYVCMYVYIYICISIHTNKNYKTMEINSESEFKFYFSHCDHIGHEDLSHVTRCVTQTSIRVTKTWVT